MKAKMVTNSTNVIYRDLSYQIMAAIFEVHKELGSGYLESVYEKALLLELTSRGMNVGVQKVFDLTYIMKEDWKSSA